MNTKRSENKVRQFLNSGPKFKRITQKYERIINSSPDKVFSQLCPSRELDWINGWDCNLIFTSTGYAEKDCIFSTNDNEIFGGGLWIFTEFVPNEKVQIVRIIENSLVVHIRIYLTDNNDGTTTGKWDEQFTALNERGNEIIETLPEADTNFINELNYFLENGEMKTTNL